MVYLAPTHARFKGLDLDVVDSFVVDRNNESRSRDFSYDKGKIPGNTLPGYIKSQNILRLPYKKDASKR